MQEDEILVLGFDTLLALGKGTLSIRFTGTLNDQMKGFYRRYSAVFALLYLTFHAKFC